MTDVTAKVGYPALVDSPVRLRLVMGALGALPVLAPIVSMLGHLDALSRPANAVPPSTVFAVTAGAAYGWFWLGPGRRRARWLLSAMATAATLCAVVQPGASVGIVLLWGLPAVLAGFSLRPRRALWAQLGLCSVATVAVAGRARLSTDPRSALFPDLMMLALIVLAGAAAVAVNELQQANRQLRTAQAEIGRLAVEEERARFARDVHDLLGHTLSLMLVKLQVTRKTLHDPSRAQEELCDMQRLARTALDDVRETISGYRQPTLASELAGGRTALDAAGIDLTVEDRTGPWPSAVEGALAWGLREAVTNIIRHSRATRCQVSIRQDDHHACLEVTDNGRGLSHTDAQSGLHSLRDRVQAVGGHLHAGPHPGGGCTVVIAIPLQGRRAA
jgi:two-component system, NarL family, sensor histidine kinase DesK